jgi:antitoxin MazE
MAAIVVKWGDSLAIRIPENLAEDLHLAEGIEVDLSAVDGTLVIKPRSGKRYSLDELIKRITPENLHTEIDSGIAVGNEF